MNNEQRTALEASIKHWKDNLKAAKKGKIGAIHIGVSTCACCDLYFDNNCKDCPIYEYTGMSTCGATPYEDVAEEHSDVLYKKSPDLTNLIDTIEDEIDFLEEVLKNSP